MSGPFGRDWDGLLQTAREGRAWRAWVEPQVGPVFCSRDDRPPSALNLVDLLPSEQVIAVLGTGPLPGAFLGL